MSGHFIRYMYRCVVGSRGSSGCMLPQGDVKRTDVRTSGRKLLIV